MQKHRKITQSVNQLEFDINPIIAELKPTFLDVVKPVNVNRSYNKKPTWDIPEVRLPSIPQKVSLENISLKPLPKFQIPTIQSNLSIPDLNKPIVFIPAEQARVAKQAPIYKKPPSLVNIGTSEPQPDDGLTPSLRRTNSIFTDAKPSISSKPAIEQWEKNFQSQAPPELKPESLKDESFIDK